MYKIYAGKFGLLFLAMEDKLLVAGADWPDQFQHEIFDASGRPTQQAAIRKIFSTTWKPAFCQPGINIVDVVMNDIFTRVLLRDGSIWLTQNLRWSENGLSSRTYGTITVKENNPAYDPYDDYPEPEFLSKQVPGWQKSWLSTRSASPQTVDSLEVHRDTYIKSLTNGWKKEFTPRTEAERVIAISVTKGQAYYLQRRDNKQQLVAGAEHLLCLCDGGVLGRYNNKYHQLSVASEQSFSEYKSIDYPSTVSVQYMGATAYGSLLVIADGRVLARGLNDKNQLGHNDPKSEVRVDGKICFEDWTEVFVIPTLQPTSIIEIVAGDNFTLLRVNDEVFVTGLFPRKIPKWEKIFFGKGPIEKIAASGEYGLIQLKNAEVYVRGSGFNLQKQFKHLGSTVADRQVLLPATANVMPLVCKVAGYMTPMDRQDAKTFQARRQSERAAAASSIQPSAPPAPPSYDEATQTGVAAPPPPAYEAARPRSASISRLLTQPVADPTLLRAAIKFNHEKASGAFGAYAVGLPPFSATASAEVFAQSMAMLSLSNAPLAGVPIMLDNTKETPGGGMFMVVPVRKYVEIIWNRFTKTLIAITEDGQLWSASIDSPSALQGQQIMLNPGPGLPISMRNCTTMFSNLGNFIVIFNKDNQQLMNVFVLEVHNHGKQKTIQIAPQPYMPPPPLSNDAVPAYITEERRQLAFHAASGEFLFSI